MSNEAKGYNRSCPASIAVGLSGNNPKFVVILSALLISPAFSRPTWAEINLPLLSTNALSIRGEKKTPLIAVIKANAYGHGAVQVARALREQVRHFAVASVDEGRALREAGIQEPILLLSAILPEEAPTALEWDLMPTLGTLEVAQALNTAAKAQNKTARAHWKIDTGMGRVGAWHEDAFVTLRALQGYSSIKLCGVYTHFAASDENDAMTRQQIALFDETLRACGILEGNSGVESSIMEPIIHAANSAGALRYPQAHYSAVRCGLALYGASPFGSKDRDYNLRPVMSLRARITEVRSIRAGRSVSYGATWTAQRDSRIALVPLGYADGYMRSLSNCGEVLLRGQRCPIVGRVTMDQILVDITELSSNVTVGEIVTAWGEDENGILLPAEEVAEKAGTIAYELMTGVSSRVPRVYQFET